MPAGANTASTDGDWQSFPSDERSSGRNRISKMIIDATEPTKKAGFPEVCLPKSDVLLRSRRTGNATALISLGYQTAKSLKAHPAHYLTRRGFYEKRSCAANL